MHECLAALTSALSECGESALAARVHDLASGSTEALNAFLVSNCLWGGAGSIADQAGFTDTRTDRRRKVEAALIQLGREQIRLGHVNPRTASWVSAFEKWAEGGI